MLGEERVGGRHARAEGARVELLGGGEVEAEERDAVAQRRVRGRRPATGRVEHEARSAPRGFGGKGARSWPFFTPAVQIAVGNSNCLISSPYWTLKFGQICLRIPRRLGKDRFYPAQ